MNKINKNETSGEDLEHRITRRSFLNSSAAASAGVAALVGLGMSGQASAHVVEINAMAATPEQAQAFLALPARPIVMVNMLKFKANGGAAEYAKYGAKVIPLVLSLGGKLLFSGETAMSFIGNGDWDRIALLEYPSPQTFLQMASSPEYAAIAGPRNDGLEGQILYAVWQN